ncbi:MAG: hypothetical protein ACM3NF_02285, partial [Gemmatimonadota bacterium]
MSGARFLALGLLMAMCAGDARGGSVPEFHLMPIRRLSPREFPELPRGVVRALESRGCEIPQTWLYDEPGNRLYKKPHNVIRGSFRGPGETDWAVLCSHHDSSTILIFWGGDASAPMTIACESDEGATQDVDGKGNLGYSRLLAVASPSKILRYNPNLKARAGDPGLHDGVEDYFVEMASVIYYFQ